MWTIGHRQNKKKKKKVLFIWQGLGGIDKGIYCFLKYD